MKTDSDLEIRGMTLEHEMLAEITRLENELTQIDNELRKLQEKTVNLINIRKKKEYNLAVLKSNFAEVKDDKEVQTNLTRLLKEL